MPDSPFLRLPAAAHVAANALAFAVRDGFPVSPGHTLVIPRRVVPAWFDATREEQLALLELIDEVKRQLDATLRPDGYNVGFNAGAAAGQTVMHLHVHVIPRFDGDIADPRGGVRHVIPGRGNYLVDAPAPLSTGGTQDPLSHHVLPLLARATEVAVVAAFVQESGLDRIRPAVQAALRGGAQIRLITGDYLDITQASALEVLLDWQQAPDEVTGVFEARVIEVGRLPPPTRSFHPKSWQLTGPGFAVGWVGSSNLSRAALDTGIEWNLRVDRDSQPIAWAHLRAATDALWAEARPLTPAWVADYARRARPQRSAPPAELEADPLPATAVPNPVQAEALAALRQARAEGRRRALVVLATGLGKTWLAGFDYGQLWDALGRQPRLLFVAHRRELLRQAARTCRRLVHDRGGDPRVGWFLGEHADLDAPLVFASVAKLSRPANLGRLAASDFDYVVVDEVHHATAASYRALLRQVDPTFLLGLTATPDRADAADVLALFDDHLAYRAGLGRGIEVGRLVPFRYYGVPDDVDYTNIPWRNRRFDPELLAAAVQTERRMQTLWSAWQAHPGQRTLVFCCSIAHAGYVAAWLRARGLTVAEVHSGSADRDDALAALTDGRLDALCAVDVLNEGVDLPAVDRVVLLRPTESGVVFLQQLGRGLRAAPGKDALTVLDFVGNHRLFRERLRTLLSAADATDGAAYALAAAGHVSLPAGCDVTLTLEAKALFAALLGAERADPAVRAYRALRDHLGERPTAGALLRRGVALRSLREAHGGWFAFVGSEGDLTPDEARALAVGGPLLADLETTALSASFKLLTLQALVDADALVDGLPVREVALAARMTLLRTPELRAELPPQHRPELADEAAVRRWVAYWRERPIAALTQVKQRERTWFTADGDQLRLTLAVPPDARAALTRMVDELLDYRLTQYRRRSATSEEGFVCRVTWNQRHPILALPDGPARGDVEARLPDGAPWTFRFAKHFCNVASPAGTRENRLPELLTGWFGPQAGTPGTHAAVRFTASPDGLWVAPEGEPALLAAEPPPSWDAGPVHRLAAGELASPTRLRAPAPADPDAPLHVHADAPAWRGIARWDADAGLWALPEVDFATWRAFGHGRSASRPLPDALRDRAQRLVDALLALPEAQRVLEHDGRTARVLGSAPKGGLRLDAGGHERTVSLLDLGWALAAGDDVASHGGLLDEARVNRLRYLAGTPKGATRWIDTAWALAALARADAEEQR